MFHALQILTVLASVVSKVLSSGPDLYKCPNVYYEFLHKRLRSRYEIYPVQTIINVPVFNVKGYINGDAVYIYSDNAAIDYTSNVTQVQFGTRHTNGGNGNSHNSSLSWSYAFLVAGIANIVPQGETGFYKVDDERCQVYTFTTEEHWSYKNQVNILVSDRCPLDPHNIPADLKTGIRNLIMPCLKEHICALVNNVLRNATPNSLHKSLVLSMRINNAVDRSLRRFREDVIRHRAETIKLGSISALFSTNNATGNFSNAIVSSDGTLENISTIERLGEATANLEGNGYNITSTCTFREAHVRFEYHDFKYEKIQFRNELSVFIKDLQIQITHLGLQHFGVCNDSVSVNVTKIDGLQYKFSTYGPIDSVLSNVWNEISSSWEIEMKEILRVYLEKKLLQLGAADYSDNIFGLCMSNSYKVQDNIDTSEMN